MKYIYTSVFSAEMPQYLNLLREEGRYIPRIQSSLRSLDKYLANCGFAEKTLDAETITSWLKTREVGAVTKANDIYRVKGFTKYLMSLGIKTSCPEVPKTQSDYVPYLFSDAEFERIFSVADNFEAVKFLTRSAYIFPVLLRVLYGCGLRLGEGQSLQWKNVDLENGVLTIREAKNLKQRFVPMDESLTALIRAYRTMTQSDGICDDYLFECHCNPGEPYRIRSFYVWFTKVIKAAGIIYAKHNSRERGPCTHCLRHCFTLKSFLRSESEGRRFEDTAPVLAAYLGHDGPEGTETYLTSNHLVYTQSHQRVGAAIGHLFPEVRFDEE